jgi:hypothetical protein
MAQAEQFNRIFDLDKTFFHDLRIEVTYEPKLLYTVTADIGVMDWAHTGKYKTVMTTINRRLRHFTEITFGDQNIRKFFDRDEN